MASPTTPSLLHQSQLPNTPPHIGPPESRSQPSAPHDNAPSRKFLLPYPVSPPTSRAIASPANSLSSLEQPRDLLSLSRQASHAPNPSPSTSTGSALGVPAYSPTPLAAAALTPPPIGLASPQALAAAAAPNSSATRATPTRPSTQAPPWLRRCPSRSLPRPIRVLPPRNLRRARTDAAPSLLFPLRRRVVVTVLLPKAGLESYRSEILAGINAQLCGFMFASGIIPFVEQTVGDPYRVARRVYGRLLFSWPSQEDAAAFRKLFPLTLKVSNSRPLLLKVFEDRFAAFTAAKAAGAPTLSIRNIPLDFDPEDIHAYLLGSTKSDGSH
ncbi:unnamed protein product [Closterium sp. NIES-65]|nr:unnamed protein product [Closterium sp. NIES-65]